MASCIPWPTERTAARRSISKARGVELNNHPLFYWPHMKGFISANEFCRNIVTSTQKGRTPLISVQANVPAADGLRDALGRSDYNLFYNTAGGDCLMKSPEMGTVALDRWQKAGNDKHSVVADPLFVDPSKDDYRLKPDSPALKLGFLPIPVEKIGIRAAEAENELNQLRRDQ